MRASRRSWEATGWTKAEFAALLPEVRSLALLKAFDLTRWAIDRCPTRIDEIAEQARQVVASAWTGHSALLP